MTLTSFKHHLKLSGILILLICYALGFYLLGKYSVFGNIVKFKENTSGGKNSLERPVESPVPYADIQSGKVISSFVKLCSNTFWGYELAYPKDWFTTYNNDSQKCVFFAPYSFVVPADTSFFISPIRIEIINTADWQETLKFYQNPNDFQNVLSSESIQINDRPVQKIKATTTENGQLSRGFTKITYLIFDSEIPIAIVYQQLDEKEDVKLFEDVLLEMAGSLRLF
ncbi:hypothetical protein HYT18_05135 [Candidatus Microgenomates bacterium]|nr:hypothetical protein [Candidatus Microgenomates bacterium]